MSEFTEAEKEEILRDYAKTPALKANALKVFEQPIVYNWNEYYYQPGEHRAKWQGAGAHVVITFGPWIARNLVNKGLSKLVPFTRRLMTREEAIDDMLRWRMHLISYDNWQNLINDEKTIGADPAFVQELIDYSLRHKLRVPYNPDYVPPPEAPPIIPVEQLSFFPLE